VLHRERSKRAGAHIDKGVSGRGDFVVSLDAIVCCCAPIAFRTPLDQVRHEWVEERRESLRGFK
jgi:hypothetical protein